MPPDKISNIGGVGTLEDKTHMLNSEATAPEAAQAS